jgi:MinD-like ATPase involved in chromosome partitioning or flagellar assembly
VTAGLLTAGSGHGWETELVAALDRPGAPFAVLRRCADLADVLAMASTGQAAAAVVSSDLRRLDSEAVSRLAGLGVAVVAVHRAGDARAPVRLGRVGIAVTISDDVGSAAILDAVVGLVHPDDGEPQPGAGGAPDPARGAVAPGTGVAPISSSDRQSSGSGASRSDAPAVGEAADPAGSAEGATTSSRDRLAWLRRRSTRPADPMVSDPAAALGPGTSEPSQGAGQPGLGDQRGSRPVTGPDTSRGSGERISTAGQTSGADPAESRPSGTVIAVWGPTGAPGRSTVAMGIADEAAVAGSTVLLIDADVYGGVLAAAFGLLDESPGLAGACRMASNGRLDGPTLAGLCWSLGPRWSLLTGIARADRWPEVRPSAIPLVLAVARGLADVVVIDCAAILETDEEISFDTMAPRRNGATLAVLGEADVVIAVGAGDPPGIERLVRGLAQLGEAVPQISPRVVVNRTRRSAASRREIDDAIFRFTGLGVAAQLPEDRDATDRAWRRCVGLSQAAPRSALRAGLAGLTRGLVPPAPSSALLEDPYAVVPRVDATDQERPAVGVGADEVDDRRRRGRHKGTNPG